MVVAADSRCCFLADDFVAVANYLDQDRREEMKKPWLIGFLFVKVCGFGRWWENHIGGVAERREMEKEKEKVCKRRSFSFLLFPLHVSSPISFFATLFCRAGEKMLVAYALKVEREE